MVAAARTWRSRRARARARPARRPRQRAAAGGAEAFVRSGTFAAMGRWNVRALVLVGFAVSCLTLASPAAAYRPPSPEEQSMIDAAIRNASESDFAFSLRDIRVSRDGLWATAVIHPHLPPSQAQDAIGVYKLQGTNAEQVQLGSEICFDSSLRRLGMSPGTSRNLGIPKCYEPPPRILVNNNLGEGRFVYKPRRFFIAADGAFGILNVRWTHYGGRVATARAKAFANDCKPFCLGGTHSYHPARLRLSKVVYCQGVRTYAQLRYILRGDVPSNIPRRNTFSLLPRDESGHVDCRVERPFQRNPRRARRCHTIAQNISNRRGVSCKRARQVAERSRKAQVDIPECAGDPPRHWNDWSIVGSGGVGTAVSATFTKGRRSFLLSGGGVC